MAQRTILSLAFAFVGISGCGEAAPDPKDPFAQFTAAAEQMQKAAEGFTQRKPVPPVAFGELIGFLPGKVAGLKRQEPKGETTTVGSWRYSQAEVNFASEEGSRHLEVGIFDYAHIPFLYLPFHAILNMNVSKESTDGYQRSTKIDGYPGFEEWNKSGNSEAVVLLGERFIVKAQTRGMGEGAARKVLEDMDLKGLAGKGP